MIMLLSCIALMAQQITERGFGQTEEQARISALANLSNSIYVKVEAKITEIAGEENERTFARTLKEISTSSNLPLLGTKFLPAERKKSEYWISVILEADQALPLYEDKLNGLHKTLKEASILLTGKTDSFTYDRLLKARNLLEEFETHRFIYLALGGKKEFNAPFSEMQVSTALNEMTKEFDDLQLALEVSAKRFASYKNVFLYYPSVYPSDEITPFSRAVYDRLSTIISTTEKPELAEYYLRSSYEIHKSGINLTLRLIDSKSNIKESIIVKLKPKAYADYEIQPQTIDLAKQIASGELISNKLNVQISGIDGNQQLFFKKGDIAQFKVKSNLPIEFFIVVHNYKKDGVYSYLLPMGSGFVKRISAEETGHWVMLDQFEVVEPFGVETLQLFASTGDISKMVPPVKKDPKHDLYKISDNPEDTVAQTRGLKPVKKEVETAEASLTITSVEK